MLTFTLLPIVAGGSPDQSSTDPLTAATAGSPNADAQLAGTAWRLVEIFSMKDCVDVPEDLPLYTLEFKADGSIEVQADCNRGAGSWTSTTPLEVG